MPITSKNQHRVESTNNGAKGASVAATNGMSDADKEMTEEERLKAMFAADSGAWKAEQSQMAHKPLVRSNFTKPTSVPDKPPPQGYTCFRCGQKGHWIQACPTNTDPNWDRRFKKTTGIPSSMLHKVEKVLDEDGKPDFSKLPAGVMVNANGDWMVAAPDKAAWDKFQEKQMAAAEKAKDNVTDNHDLREQGLECSIDSRLFNDPVKTPCCNKTYCRDCIENALLDGDLLCPNCGEQVLLDKLEVDEDTVQKIKAYEEEKKAEKNQADKASSQSPPADKDTPKQNNSNPASPSPNVPELSNDSRSPSISTQSLKRSADEELENDHRPDGPQEPQASDSKSNASASPQSIAAVPTGPKALHQRQSSQTRSTPIPNSMEEFTKQMNAMSGGMNTLPNGMPGMMNPMMGMPGMPPMMGMPGMMNPMMGMPMPMGMNMNMNMGMPGMGNFGGMNMNAMNGMNANGMYGNGMSTGNNGWANQQNHNWNHRNNGPNTNFNNNHNNGNGNESAYFRQPVNPHRQQGRQRRQRSIDYKQM